jgi:hypothetical protein
VIRATESLSAFLGGKSHSQHKAFTVGNKHLIAAFSGRKEPTPCAAPCAISQSISGAPGRVRAIVFIAASFALISEGSAAIDQISQKRLIDRRYVERLERLLPLMQTLQASQ